MSDNPKDCNIDASYVPVNKTAGMVISKGTHYDPISCKKMIDNNHLIWDIPPKIRNHPDHEYSNKIIGIRRGRMVIIGYLGRNSSGHGTWLAKCDCGKYESRVGRLFSRNKDIDDMCIYCKDLESLKIKDKNINKKYRNCLIKDTENYRKERGIFLNTWDSPLETISVPEGIIDLTGQRRGLVTIVGYLSLNRWLIKCDCGRYEKRKEWKWIQNKLYFDMCNVCNYQDAIKKGFRKRGNNLESPKPLAGA